MATGEQDSTVHFWHQKSGEDAQMWGFPNKVLELSWHSSGRWLATGGGSQISLWDCSGAGPAGRKPRQYDEHLGKVTQLAFQPGTELLASSDTDSLLFLWAPVIQDKIMDGRKLGSPATILRWSQHSKLAVGQQDGNIVFFDLQQSSDSGA